MFLKVLISFLIISEVTGADTLKMMKIFGKVLNADLEGTVDPDCVQTCFEASNCILAYVDTSGRCQLFNFNETETLEVEETYKEDGLFVAFKTTLPNDTCPAYKSIPPVVNIGEDPVSWKKSGKTFSFQKCIGDWKMFNRTGLTVCMQFTYYRFKKLYPGEPQGWSGVWMDGVRNCTGFKEANCRNFDWSDGYTESQDALVASNARLSYKTDNGNNIENCLQIFIYSEQQTINDVDCDHTGSLDLGAACGYRLA